MKREVHVRSWSARVDDDPLDRFSFGESPRYRTPSFVRVDLELLMSPRAYDVFREMMRRQWDVDEPRAQRPELPPASPKLPEHDAIDAEFAAVKEGE